MKELSFMERNELDANKKVARITRITCLFMVFLLILDYINIFIIDKKIMTLSIAAAIAVLLIPTLLTDVFKIEKSFVKYIDITAASIMVLILYTTLTYHIPVVFIYPLVISGLYFSKRPIYFASGITIVSTSIAQMLALSIVKNGFLELGINPEEHSDYDVAALHDSKVINMIFDLNFSTTLETVLYGIVPRSLCIFAMTMLFTGLTTRTAKLLENALSADEQASLFEKMKNITTKSREVSGTLVASLTTLEQNANESKNVNKNISDSANNVTEASKRTVEQVIEADKHIDSITENLESMSSEAASLFELSENVSDLSSDNNAIIQTAGRNMEEINAKMIASKEVIGELQTSSNQIKQIVEVITGISAQTNLLALNAAIESARAGEAGRGFAVVADEIRELADKTKTAVGDIGHIISGVVDNTEKAVVTMDESMAIAASGLDIMSRAVKSTEEITVANNRMKEQIQSVNSETKEITDMSKKIVEIINSISNTAGTNLSDMQKVSEAAESGFADSVANAELVEKLKEVADRLSEIVSME